MRRGERSAKHPLAALGGLRRQGQRLGQTTLLFTEEREVMLQVQPVEVPRREQALPAGLRLQVKRLRPGQIPLGVKELCQITQTGERLGMVRTLGVGAPLQGAAVERLGTRQIPLI